MITRAQTAHKTALEALFCEAFPGEDAFCAWYFSTRWKPEQTLVYLQHGTPCAMLHLLDCPLSTGESARYLFALATAKEQRGKGLMGALLAEALTLCRAQQVETVTLLVQEESLFAYYARFGFVPDCFVTRSIVAAAPLPHAMSLRPAIEKDTPALLALYEAALCTVTHGLRTSQSFAALLEAYTPTCWVLETDGQIYAYAIGGAVQADTYFLTECIGPNAPQLAAALASQHGTAHAQLQSAPIAHRTPLGCSLRLGTARQSQGLYLNLMYN